MERIVEKAEALKIADRKGRITLGSRYAGKTFALREEADGTTVLTPVLIVPEKDRPLTSRRLTENFAALESLQENWDGHGSPAPAHALITYAREVLALFHAAALAHSLPWEEPHIGSNERGQITLEWWHDPRTLTVFIRSEEQVDYLKSWGSDILKDMEDGEITRPSDFIALTRWLYYEGIPRP